jgi:pimeloyl-ACP methyl ester carboxylesterase
MIHGGSLDQKGAIRLRLCSSAPQSLNYGDPMAVHRIPTSDGRVVIAEVHGAGSVPIVLLHGLSQQRHFWDPVRSHLQAHPVITVDLRGHGDADVPEDSDFGVARCSQDVVEALSELGFPQAVVVGHSWGASVALHLAAHHPDLVLALVLLDGGVANLAHLGDPAEVRIALTPPALGIPAQDLWKGVQSGALRDAWSPSVQAALAPTFIERDGVLVTRLGMTRHMAILDGLLAYDPLPDLQSLTMPTWIILCDTMNPAWSQAQDRTLAELDSAINVQRWSGAVHDVPLQWPDIVAGLVDDVWQSVTDVGE